MSSIIETMKQRKSVRNYDENKKIEEAKLNTIEQTLKSLNTETMRFVLIDSDLKGIKLGTYGFITGAKHYIVGIVKGSDKANIVNFGSRFENIVLKATEQGLGTCWMIGTYNPKDFADDLNLQEGEAVVIVSPLGYEKKKERIRDKIIRVITGNHKRKPFETLFFDGAPNTPLTQSKTDVYTTALEMVRIAPSASNKQPWRVIKAENRFHFYTKEEPLTKYRGVQCCYNDVGIAIEHFQQASKELNLKGRWSEETSPQVKDWEYIRTWVAE